MSASENGLKQLNQSRTPPRNAPCACGSGLRGKHCCSQLQLVPPTRQQTDLVEDEYLEAEQAFEKDQPEQARRLVLAVLAQFPCHTRALRLLYHCLRQSDEAKAAEILLRRLIGLTPQNHWPYSELALMLYERGDLIEAEQQARNVVRLVPDNAQAHNLMGMILTESHRLLAGEFHYRQALALHGPLGKLCANLGLNLRQQGKLEEAEEMYTKALELEPDNTASLMGWIRLKEVSRNIDDAERLFQQARQKIPPDSIGACMTHSLLLRRRKDLNGALAALEQANTEHAAKNPAYHYEQGEVLDKLGRYDEAFGQFSEANRIVRERAERQYRAQRSAQLAQRLKAFFAHQRVDRLPRGEPAVHETATPIFIIGFPRSGTTMVEQILTTHKSITAGDELHFISELAAAAPKMLNSSLAYPECLADLWFGDNQAALETFRFFYQQKVRQMGILDEGAAYFTDKMPLNETNLGLIHLVFPEAPVIHLIRHPLDVVLSCYFNDLTHGNNMSYGLETAAQHYVLIRDLLDHYLNELDINYLPVRYEDIIDEPEPNARKILDFIGVDWDPQCLEFHENPRYARTASYAQVTEKLYSRSCFRYKNYIQHLQPIIPMLEPVITRLGYDI